MPEPRSELSTRPSLLARLRDAGDGEAWQTFVTTYTPLVYCYCRKRGVQDADAADIAQEVLTRVARSMRTFEYQPERGRFRDWLGAVTRHELTRFFNRRQPGTRGAGGDEPTALLAAAIAPEADTEWTAEFNARLLRVALGRIRPLFAEATWRAFARVWMDGRPAPEAAVETGLPIDKVYAAKSRVLKRLRDELLLLAEDLPQFLAP